MLVVNVKDIGGVVDDYVKVAKLYNEEKRETKIQGCSKTTCFLALAVFFLTSTTVRAGDATAFCLTRLSDDIRRHTPRSTNLGSAVVNISFHVNRGGSLSRIIVTSSSPMHAELAKRIMASSRGPKSCGETNVNTALEFH